MNRHITYCTDNMTISARHASESALAFGCQTSTIYRLHDLNKDFLKRNAETLSCERGAGYWCWKPQIILQEFEKCKEGDLVIYTDAGIEFVDSIHHIEKIMGSDWCFLFQNMSYHHEYCKGDVLMLSKKENQFQLQASVVIFRATTKAVNFLSLWSEMCQNKQMIDDEQSHAPNHPDFKEHRHDQAILTSLQLLYELPVHWWPAKYVGNDHNFTFPKRDGNGRMFHEGDYYPILFNHHRKRNEEW